MTKQAAKKTRIPARRAARLAAIRVPRPMQAAITVEKRTVLKIESRDPITDYRVVVDTTEDEPGDEVTVRIGCREFSIAYWRSHGRQEIEGTVSEVGERMYCTLDEEKWYYPRKTTTREEATVRKYDIIEKNLHAFLDRVEAELAAL